MSISKFALAAVCGATAGLGVVSPTLVSTAHAESSLVVSVAGDIACGTKVAAYNNGDGTGTQCRQRYTAALLPGSQQVWTLGDHVYPTATTTQFSAAYDPTWGQSKAITYPSPGDHDYGTTGGKAYFAYFGVQPYYSFEAGAWHVVSLDSEIDHSAGSAQEQWLQADLAAHPNQCVAAYWGATRWTSGNKGNDASFGPFWTDLYAAHADLVLGGDVHNYERFAPMDPSGAADANGLQQFVVGTGGRSLVGFPHVQPTSQQRVKAFGVLRLDLHDASYDWQFLDQAGAVRDSGSATCG